MDLCTFFLLPARTQILRFLLRMTARSLPFSLPQIIESHLLVKQLLPRRQPLRNIPK